MNFEKFTIKSQEALQKAAGIATSHQQQAIEPGHLLQAILETDENVSTYVFKKLNINDVILKSKLEEIVSAYPKVSGQQAYLSHTTNTVLQNAEKELRDLKDEFVSIEHLLLALLATKDKVSSLMKDVGFERSALIKAIKELRGGARVADQNAEAKYKSLERYSKNLNDLAKKGKIDPVIGRDEEIRRVLQILSRRTKNNPILLGEPGVGKTAIVEGLAQRIVDGNVPLFIANKKILALDLSLIVAGTKYRGQFEERLKGIIRELRENPDLIIFIDEIHSLIGAGSAEGSLDAANILKPALSRGEISCIGATTLKEYRKYIEKDRSLLRRFQAIQVNPPTPEQTQEILEGVKDRYESFHKVRYRAEALRTAIYQSSRYIPDRHLPDKAIDVIDEAGARVKLRRVRDTQNLRRLEQEIRQVVKEMKVAISDKDFERAVYLREREIELREDLERMSAAADETGVLEVTRHDIEEVISSWTGIPVAALQSEEAERLLKMEEILKLRVVGQDRSINA